MRCRLSTWRLISILKSRSSSVDDEMMMRLRVLLVLAFVLSLPMSLCAEVDWVPADSWEAASAPLDSALTEKGGRLFLLTPGEVLIYSAQGVEEGRIPVEKTVDRIDVSPAGDLLYLFSGQSRKVRTVSIEYIRKIDSSGSPFLGPPGAQVELVVFSDFQ